MLLPTTILSTTCRSIFTTATRNHIIKQSRLRVVDNSEIGRLAMMEGRPPRCIHVYNKIGIGFIGKTRKYRVTSFLFTVLFIFLIAALNYLGDRILVAIKGEKKKGILVGLKQKQSPKVPKFDSNNLVLIDDNGTPLGTRIHVPIPHILRTRLKEQTHSKGADYTKLLAIASRFV